MRRKTSCPRPAVMFVTVTSSQAEDHDKPDLSQPQIPPGKYYEHWERWLKTSTAIWRSVRMSVMVVVVSTPCPRRRPYL